MVLGSLRRGAGVGSVPGRPWSLALGLALLLVLAALPARAHPGAPYLIALEEKAGPYTVTAWADPDTGEGTFLVDLVGNPEAAVSVRVRPEDGHLPEAEYPAVREETRDGVRHVARVPFDQVGPWEAVLVVKGPSGEGTVARKVDVTPPGLEWWQTALLLLPFAAVGGLWLLGLRKQSRSAAEAEGAQEA